MTPTDLSTALTDVRDAADVPPVDRVAFQARVRAHRRRRTAGRVALATTAAGVAAAAAAVLPGAGLGGDADGGAPDVAEGPTAAVDLPLTAPVWFVQGQRLTALDPAGTTHRLDVEVESVVGWTTEHVYALTTDGILVGAATRWDAERSRLWVDAEHPVTPLPVGGAALSGDGRFLAWTQDGAVTVSDLKAGTTEVDDLDGATAIASVGAAGVLVSGPRELTLRDGEREVDVPLPDGADAADAQLALDRVLVPLRDGRSQLWDVSGPSARLEATLDGVGRLGPYAERTALLSGSPASLGVVEVGPGGSMDLTVSGLEGLVPEEARWADETLLLVSVRDAEGTPQLVACDIGMDCAPLPVDGEAGLQ